MGQASRDVTAESTGSGESYGMASRDVTAESTSSSDSYGMASNRNEITPAYKSTCISHLDREPYHDGRTKDTDEGICLADGDEADEETGNDDKSAEGKENEVKRRGGKNDEVKEGHEDANKCNDKNVDEEIEEESERGREHRSERRTIDYACKPMTVDDNQHLLAISETAAGQHEVQAGECLRGT